MSFTGIAVWFQRASHRGACCVWKELACAEEAANDAAGVASAAADASDHIVSELRVELAEAKKREQEAASKVSSMVSKTRDAAAL